MDVSKIEFLETQLVDLKKDSKELETASVLVHSDTSKLQKSIYSNETKIQAARREIDELHAKIALLSGRSRCLKESSLISEELSNRIEAKLEKWKRPLKSGQEKTYFSKTDGTDGKVQRGANLEPACERKVRLACEKIYRLKRSQLERDVYDSERDGNEQNSKDQIWTQLEDLLADFKPKNILDSLNQNTFKSTKSLELKTRQVDLTKDAAELRFKFESGKLRDVSQQPVLLRSVDQLIEQGQKTHFQRFLEAEKAKNDVWRERKRFEKAQQIFNNELHKKYGSNIKELNLNRRVLDLEIDLYSIDAAIAYIKELIIDLSNQKTSKQKAEESLLAKYKKIQEFEAKAQKKQLMIQTLVKKNGTARSHLEQQQNELQTYLKNHITVLGSEIDAKVNGLKQKHSKELELFSLLPISKLRCVELQNGSKTSFDDMSIHHFETSRSYGSRLLKPMAEALHVPSYSAPEELLLKIKEMKEEELQLLCQSERGLHKNEAMVSEAFIEEFEKLKDHCKMMSDEAELRMHRTQPALKGSFANATDALKDCLELEKMIHVWWDQPAQFLVPWVKEDGLNLRQWHTQWEVNSARLAQMQLLK